jgi:hypothetical protein
MSMSTVPVAPSGAGVMMWQREHRDDEKGD